MFLVAGEWLVQLVLVVRLAEMDHLDHPVLQVDQDWTGSQDLREKAALLENKGLKDSKGLWACMGCQVHQVKEGGPDILGRRERLEPPEFQDHQAKLVQRGLQVLPGKGDPLGHRVVWVRWVTKACLDYQAHLAIQDVMGNWEKLGPQENQANQEPKENLVL